MEDLEISNYTKLLTVKLKDDKTLIFDNNNWVLNLNLGYLYQKISI